jgi:antitoxin component YwqK of YwqJK toxin-antitoxin module
MSIDINSFTSYTSPGNMYTPHNVKFGHAYNSVMECFREGTLNSIKSFENARVKSDANPLIIDFQEEIIEIPEGNGLSVRLYRC